VGSGKRKHDALLRTEPEEGGDWATDFLYLPLDRIECCAQTSPHTGPRVDPLDVIGVSTLIVTDGFFPAFFLLVNLFL